MGKSKKCGGSISREGGRSGFLAANRQERHGIDHGLGIEHRAGQRLDVIGGEWLTEINVTSPTGIVAIDRFNGTDSAGMIWDAIKARLGR